MEEQGFLPRSHLQVLLDELTLNGYRCIGPQMRDGAIVYATLTDVDNLPQGINTQQLPGSYKVQKTDGNHYFAWANGHQALKPYLFSPREKLWAVGRNTENRLTFTAGEQKPQPLAVIGVRACDLAALCLQDQHFLEGNHPDPNYEIRRAHLFLVTVHCSHPAETCFCASTGDGPRATEGFDLALSELDDGFVVQVGSDAGRAVYAHLPLERVTANQLQMADQKIEQAAKIQRRRLPSADLRDTLFANLEHPRWDTVAQRCLSCGNCTSVCPTCFCYTEVEQTHLDGSCSEHYRQWDSCFTQGHSYIHGITIRAETRTRYRQWLTHKLGSWRDQYGRSGCVGCGRCITWCPTGIDITEEAAAVCEASHDD